VTQLQIVLSTMEEEKVALKVELDTIRIELNRVKVDP